jgi:hypothetical protein
MGTPVIVVFDQWETDPRFSGLHPLLRCFSSNIKELPVQWNNPEANSDDVTGIKSKLEMDCINRVETILGRPVKKQNWWETHLSGSMIPYATPHPAL